MYYVGSFHNPIVLLLPPILNLMIDLISYLKKTSGAKQICILDFMWDKN